MNKVKSINTLCLQLLVCISLISPLVNASADHHGHDDHHDDNVETMFNKGPHGGVLLEKDNFAIEMLIVDRLQTAEMRIYGYQANVPIMLSAKDTHVELHRLGGKTTRVNFEVEGDYLVSQSNIDEPHSFEIHIEAEYQGQHAHWQLENYEGQVEINDRQLALAKVKTAIAGPQKMTLSDTLFGVISADQERVFQVTAPYIGRIEQVHVQIGDQVKKGQLLISLTNTQTLQRYSIKSIASGVITNRMANAGERAGDQALLEITDLSKVWVNLSAFPESIEKLSIGQKITVYDLHQHEIVESHLSYIAPVMTGGHIARARAVIDNTNGHWRPGMHIKSNIEIAIRNATLAVQINAVQTLQGSKVVFAKYGNVFEARPLTLGQENGEFVEVLSGLEVGTEYVTDNSFLLKADLLKEGAAHDH